MQIRGWGSQTGLTAERRGGAGGHGREGMFHYNRRVAARLTALSELSAAISRGVSGTSSLSRLC